MPKKYKYVERARDAKNGQYITKKEAKRRPSTTVIERDRVPINKKP